MRISERGLNFVTRHEGFVKKAYKDPTGTVTIGTGFTNGSKIARKHLGTIKLGMTITKEKNDQILREAFDEEYGPEVNIKMNPDQQHEFDAIASVGFNVGPGAFKWKWAEAFRRGNVPEAAGLLRTTATTSKGRKLRGLVIRRAEEAHLLSKGDYGKMSYPTFPGTEKIEEDPEIRAIQHIVLRDYQKALQELGYYTGKIDGLRGPKTSAAVLAFQKTHPQLLQDGILGKATMAQIDRTMDLRRKSVTQPSGGFTAGAGTSGTGYSVYPNGSELWDTVLVAGVGGLIIAVVVLGIVLYRYRDEIKAAWRAR